MAKIRITIQISSICTWQKSRQLFRYSLFLLGLGPRILFKYPLFLLCGKKDFYSDILCFYSDIVYSNPTSDPDCYLDILYFYLEKIWTAIQISSVPTRPTTRTTIQICSISTWQKSGLLFRYSLFLLGLGPRLLFKFPLFLLCRKKDFYSNILYFY